MSTAGIASGASATLGCTYSSTHRLRCCTAAAPANARPGAVSRHPFDLTPTRAASIVSSCKNAY
eukprot:5346972-Prymnesium_polylepis.1